MEGTPKKLVVCSLVGAGFGLNLSLVLLGKWDLLPPRTPDDQAPNEGSSFFFEMQRALLKVGITLVGVPSPLFPGTLLSTKPPNTLGKQSVFEKNDG